MHFLRQSTASQEIALGQFLAAADGAVVTGLTIANTDIKLWKTGATTLANKNSGGATEISNGVYYAVLDATDTDTLGPLDIFITVTGALSVKVQCCVLAAGVYDLLFSDGTGLAAFKKAVEGVITGVVGSGSTTTSIVTSSVSVSAGSTSCWVPRYVVFDQATTTAALRGATAFISANTTGATPTLTLASALPAAPASTDTFSIQ